MERRTATLGCGDPSDRCRRWLPQTLNLTVVAFMVLTCSLGSEAVARPEFEFSAALGPHVPLGAFNDVAKLGYLVGANLGVGISPSSFIGLTYETHRNSVTDDYRDDIGLVAGDDAQFASWMAMAYFKQLLHKQGWKPYLKIQGGVSHLELQVPGENISSSGSHFSLGGGLGIQNAIGSRYAYFGEILLHRIFVDDSIPDDLVEGNLRSFASLRVGLTLFVN